MKKLLNFNEIYYFWISRKLKMRELNIKMRFKKLNIISILTIAFFLFSPSASLCQSQLASPSCWLYPNGNYSATRYLSIPSSYQNIDSFIVKWTSPYIAGDVQPFIGNLINNPKIKNEFRWYPNEISAVIGDELIILEATGRKKPNTSLPPYIKGISFLFDTLSPSLGGTANSPLSMGLESIEYMNIKDSLAFAYLASFNHKFDTLSIIKRLAIDLREFTPNLFASVKPILGHQVGSNFNIYATVNMSKPDNSQNTQYFRGLTEFNTGNTIYTFPVPDIGDNINSRVKLAPFVNISQPSLGYINGVAHLLLPCYPDNIQNQVNNRFLNSTQANIPYLFCYRLQSGIEQAFPPINLSFLMLPGDKRPIIKPYFIDATDNGNALPQFILIAEEYSGLDSSNGIAKLHIFDLDGNPITQTNDTNFPSFIGGQNHFWSIAIGNIDGNIRNELLPYYPNNAGKEIVATHSTRDFAYPGNRLMVLRYNPNSLVPKPSPPNTFLKPFDTIATMQINGWVAAVNDIDAAPDGKDEIFIVDGSKLLVLKMRDYSDFEFQIGIPFDTVLVMNFGYEFISNIAIADLEGDGKNDIIVVTWDSLYVIGSEIPGTIKFINPQPIGSVQNYCIGDTINFIWQNILEGTKKVSIYFREYRNGIPENELILIASDIENAGDTIRFNYTLDNRLINKTGRFLIQSKRNLAFQDSTLLISVGKMTLFPQSLPRNTYPANSWVTLQGRTECIDTIYAVYSINRTDWFSLDNQTINLQNGEYRIICQLPCINYRDCLNYKDTTIHLAIIANKSLYREIFPVGSIKLTPALLPLIYYESQTSCPTKTFKWMLPPLSIECDTIEILYSIDGGKSFIMLDKVPSSIGEYKWQVPTNFPTNINLRFCCVNSCLRIDTLLTDYKPSYISIVAPNPFNPTYETLEVVYEVPEEVYATIRIYDAANRLVAEPVSNLPRRPGLAYCDRWNGNTFAGSIASSGIYYLSLELSNGKREIYHIYVRK